MRYYLLIVALLCIGRVMAQDCDNIIVNGGDNEYTQAERSTGRTFRGKAIKGDLWVNMTGGFLYLNMQFRDTVSNVTLRNIHKTGMAHFSFAGNRSFNVIIPNTTFGTIVSIPLNVNPKDGIQIRHKVPGEDTTTEERTYFKLLESFFKEQLIFVSFGGTSDDAPGIFSGGTHGCTLSEEEALKLQQSVVCILKATQ